MSGLASGILIAVVGAIAGAIATRFAEARAKVVVATTHQFLFSLGPSRVLTNAIIVQNLGRKSVDWIEIVHQWKPPHFQLWPPLNYVATTTPEGQHLIRIESLAAKEFFYLEFLTEASQAPQLLFVRSPVGHAQPIPIQLQRMFPRWVGWVQGTAWAGGAVFWLYCVAWLVMALVNLARGGR